MILVAMLAMTFIFFFKFVVDTGVLVVAKINLQNAADLAAYSGAASQARLLNQIGFLNYNMRKAYKKFLFEYYVLGTLGQESFPRNSTAMGARVYSPDPNEQPQPSDYKVPVVCIDYQNMTDPSAGSGGVANNCRISKKPALKEINFALGGAMGDIYNTFVKNLNAQIGANGCPLFGANNASTLIGWLYNADPAHKSINEAIQLANNEIQKDAKKASPLIQAIKIWELMKAVMPGVGLIPRVAIDRMRINTLTEYLNAKPTAVTLADMATLGKDGDPAMSERTIEAFYSAYNTLGPYLFDNDSIKLEELSPTGDSNYYVKLNDIKTSFTAYFLDSRTTGPDNKGCDMTPTALDVKDLIIGVSKDPSIQTYYAVRLSALARMIYWPTRSFKLKAYAAARPFGGYIGPDKAYMDRLRINQPNTNKVCPASQGGLPQFFTLTGTVPSTTCNDVFNVPNTMLGSIPDNLGFNETWIQNKFYQQILNRTDPTKLAPERVMEGVDYSQIPNPAEKNIYLIANDANEGKGSTSVLLGTEKHSHEEQGDPFNHYFHRPKTPDPNGAQLFIHHFWAPIISPTNPNAIDMAVAEIKNKLKQATTSKAGFSPVMKDRIDEIKQMLDESIEEYLRNKIYAGGADNGLGELHESLNIAAIGNPLKPAHSPTLRNDPDWVPVENPRFFMTDPKSLRRSWVTSKDDHIFNEGRVGYSVKIVRLKELTGKSGDPKASGDGNGSTATNTLAPDAEMQGDGAFDYLEH